MDQPEPPRIVFEQPAACSDEARAVEILKRTMLPARAPVSGWTMSLRTSRDKAEGEITNEQGSPVAHRTFARKTGECAGLARAVGVWANLVLDEELKRERPAAPPVVKAAAAEAPPPWPAPVINEKPSPEQYTFLKHDPEKRSLEVGVSVFIMGGLAPYGVMGPQAFVVVEADKGIFLRTSVFFGRTQKPVSLDSYGTWNTARFDACVRVPGFYLERKGIQLDGCAGPDIGYVSLDIPTGGVASRTGRTLPFFALGALLSLRGELDSRLAVEIRAMVGWNVVREEIAGLEPKPFLFRGEAGLSWALR